MKRKWKILLGIVLLLVIAGGVYASYRYSQAGIVTVQTGKVVRQDLTALVTASGEIKPRYYVNIGSNAVQPSRIMELLVKEGDRVKKGQLLARLESVQPEADVAGQRASVSSTEADAAASEAGVRAAEENIKTTQASIERAKADLERARLNFDRAQQLFKDQLIAKQDFDQRRSEYDSLAAAVRETEARLAQAKAQRTQLAASLSASQRRITQAQAGLRRATDVLLRDAMEAARQRLANDRARRHRARPDWGVHA